MSSVEDRERQLEITMQNIDDQGRVQVTVKDSGTGLSICRSLVQHHGGRQWATLNDGPGTIFPFTLPKCQGEEHRAGAAAV